MCMYESVKVEFLAACIKTEHSKSPKYQLWCCSPPILHLNHPTAETRAASGMPGNRQSRAREKGMQVAMGTKTQLTWAGGNTSGKSWPGPLESTQGVSLRAEAGSLLCGHPSCNSSQAWWLYSKLPTPSHRSPPNSAAGYPKVFLIPKTL